MIKKEVLLELDRKLHELWTEQVGTPGYDKEAFKRVEKAIWKEIKDV